MLQREEQELKLLLARAKILNFLCVNKAL